MSVVRPISIRLALSLVLVVTPLLALSIVGSITLALRLPQLAEQNRALAQQSATEMGASVEQYLSSLEDRLSIAVTAIGQSSPVERRRLIEAARGSVFDAVYLLDGNGLLIDASVKESGPDYIDDLIGLDMSLNSLFQNVSASRGNAWSETHLSVITGTVAVGVAVPDGDNAFFLVGELPLAFLVSISRSRRTTDMIDLWIIDPQGEVVADTRPTRAGRQNLAHLSVVQAGRNGKTLGENMQYDGVKYFTGAAASDALGWLFVTRVPAGLENKEIRETVIIVVIGFLSTALLGAVLAPLWSLYMSGTIRSVIDRARIVASGGVPDSAHSSLIKEFNQISRDLDAMAGALVSRERALKEMNEELEDRVQKRTRDLAASNSQLSEALQNLQMTQNDLVESEKLAALGRLVAGVAHELNTPLGNSKLSLSAQSHTIKSFDKMMEKGLRKSELVAFMDRIRETTSMASMNVERACELVSNFKQVAVDRTTSYRRKFKLSDLISGTVLTLQPSIGHDIQVLVDEIPDHIEIDSYPGELGQILTNLIDNASKHAFPERSGSIRISIPKADESTVEISVRDDGIGMEKDILQKIFDPFYTTKFGQGGTGLGLHISYNAATNVIGGNLTVDSTPGEGTIFILVIPVVAPEHEEGSPDE